MKIPQPRMSMDWKDIILAFQSEGFTTTESYGKIVVSYRGLDTTITKAIAHKTVEYVTLCARPNKKWFKTDVVSNTTVVHDIDFNSLKKELNFAADAKDDRVNKDKSIRFKMDLYKIFLSDLFDSKYFYCRPDMDLHKVTLHCRYYNDHFQIVFTNKSSADKDTLINTDMEDYMGNVLYNGTVFKYVNIKECLTKLIDNVFIHVKGKFEQEKEYRDKIVPLTEECKRKNEELWNNYNKVQSSLQNSYDLLDSGKFMSLVTKGLEKCLS